MIINCFLLVVLVVVAHRVEHYKRAAGGSKAHKAILKCPKLLVLLRFVGELVLAIALLSHQLSCHLFWLVPSS